MACKARVLLPVSKSHKQQAHIQVHSATLGGRSPLAPTLLTPGAVRGAAAAAAASAAHCSRPLSTRCTQRAGPRAGARTLLRAAWGPLADQTLPSPAARRAPPRRGRAALERHWRHPRCCCCCRWRRGRAAPARHSRRGRCCCCCRRQRRCCCGGWQAPLPPGARPWQWPLPSQPSTAGVGRAGGRDEPGQRSAVDFPELLTGSGRSY